MPTHSTHTTRELIYRTLENERVDRTYQKIYTEINIEGNLKYKTQMRQEQTMYAARIHLRDIF